MSRKRDTNWTKDEITVLLDSIMEITKTRSEDGKRTNSREVFEFAAKRMGERGHASRAEREKCRTKWKKMKEEFTHAKRAREGDTRYKQAPGIQPFYDRMEEFISGNFENISPHSTIVRRSSSISSNTTTNTNTTNTTRSSPPSRSSARISANTDGTTFSSENNDTCSTIVTKPNVADSDISYRVSAGCRQITIFGDHDVDIKFRGDCVTINKIS